MKTYVVVGLGRFGQSIACRLCELGNEVLALDKNPEYVQQISNFVTQAVVADAQDSDVLRALGIRNYDCAIVAIGKDLSASVLATLNFKEMGIPLVVCKAHDENHRKVLEKIGADRVVVPEREFANKLAQSLATSNVLEYIELSADYGISEFEAPAAWNGKSLRQLNVRARVGVNILAIRRGDGFRCLPGRSMCSNRRTRLWPWEITRPSLRCSGNEAGAYYQPTESAAAADPPASHLPPRPAGGRTFCGRRDEASGGGRPLVRRPGDGDPDRYPAGARAAA